MDDVDVQVKVTTKESGSHTLQSLIFAGAVGFAFSLLWAPLLFIVGIPAFVLLLWGRED